MKMNCLNNRVNAGLPTRRMRSPRVQKMAAKAVAAPELSPKEAGVEGAKNQLEALKQMSKIVADSGVSFHQNQSREFQKLCTMHTRSF